MKKNLTIMEKQFLNAMRSNSYSDLLETNCEWLFAVQDELPYTEKQSVGVISSLVQKNLIMTNYDKSEGEHLVSFTEEGKKLFDNADGKKCPWGGKKLLKVE